MSCSMTGPIEDFDSFSTAGIRLIPFVYSTFMDFSDMGCFALSTGNILVLLHPMNPFSLEIISLGESLNFP